MSRFFVCFFFALVSISHIGQVIDFHFIIYIFQGGYILDTYDAAHVPGGRYNLHDLVHVAWVGYICTIRIKYITD